MGAARLFFAVWPPPAAQRELGRVARELQHECGGRALPSGNIHLTLAFLGNIARDGVPRLESVAAGISGARFELAVSRVEYWRHNRIVWAGPEDCPGALRGLAAQLGQALAAEGYRLDDRPFSPHITLVRNAGRAPGPASRPAVSWRVDAFALVESAARGPGRAYQVLREWPLNA